jgi:hypothetical protein
VATASASELDSQAHISKGRLRAKDESEIPRARFLGRTS